MAAAVTRPSSAVAIANVETGREETNMKKSSHPLFVGQAFGAALLALPLALNPVASFAQEAIGLAAMAAPEDPPVFDDPTAAIEAFKSALAADDFDGVAKLLGLDPAKVKAGESASETFAKIRDGAAVRVVAEDHGDRKILDIGEKLWPLPFPLIKGVDGKWSFDTYAGLEEIVNRRVGENELEAIATAKAYVDAQNEYAQADHDGDGVLEFAQRLISTEGTTDGLYWPAELDAGTSPAGEAIEAGALEKAKAGDGYFGYRFRILKGQGENIAGGAYSYVINGNMIAGFALIGWPVTYGETGVKAFVVSHHGAVFETDLGPSTNAIVKYIDDFNPDGTWDLVTD